MSKKANQPAAESVVFDAFDMAIWVAAIVAPTQIFAGDMHGLNTLEHQP